MEEILLNQYENLYHGFLNDWIKFPFIFYVFFVDVENSLFYYVNCKDIEFFEEFSHDLHDKTGDVYEKKIE